MKSRGVTDTYKKGQAMKIERCVTEHVCDERVQNLRPLQTPTCLVEQEFSYPDVRLLKLLSISPNGVIAISCMKPRTGGGYYPIEQKHSWTGTVEEYLQIRPELSEKNRMGYDIFFSPNESHSRDCRGVRRFSDGHIESVSNVYLDLDVYKNSASFKVLKQSGISYAALVETSQGSYHAYFRLSKPVVKRDYLPLVKGLQNAVPGDAGANGYSQIARLPGFLNNKKKESANGIFTVSLVEVNYDAIIDPTQYFCQKPEKIGMRKSKFESSSIINMDLKKSKHGIKHLYDYNGFSDASQRDWNRANFMLKFMRLSREEAIECIIYARVTHRPSPSKVGRERELAEKAVNKVTDSMK